jgi:hypothetical protein
MKRCLRHVDILPIRSMLDIHIMSFPKTNCLGEFFLLSYEVKFFYFLDLLLTFLLVYIQHISTKDQLSRRLCFYEVNSFIFGFSFLFLVWWTFNIFLSKINCPGDFCNLALYDVVVFHVYVLRNCSWNYCSFVLIFGLFGLDTFCNNPFVYLF